MLSPKYYLFYKICAIILALIVMMWWLKVPDEEVNAQSSIDTHIVKLKESINETESSKRSP